MTYTNYDVNDIMLTLEAIRNRTKPVAKKYDIVNLELFGSYADGTANENSDADFLVRFAVPVPSIFNVMGFREELSPSLVLLVDVVTLPLVRPDKLRVSRTEKII
jgi:predicted nucleotidyltransferase